MSYNPTVHTTIEFMERVRVWYQRWISLGRETDKYGWLGEEEMVRSNEEVKGRGNEERNLGRTTKTKHYLRVVQKLKTVKTC